LVYILYTYVIIFLYFSIYNLDLLHCHIFISFSEILHFTKRHICIYNLDLLHCHIFISFSEILHFTKRHICIYNIVF